MWTITILLWVGIISFAATSLDYYMATQGQKPITMHPKSILVHVIALFWGPPFLLITIESPIEKIVSFAGLILFFLLGLKIRKLSVDAIKIYTGEMENPLNKKEEILKEETVEKNEEKIDKIEKVYSFENYIGNYDIRNTAQMLVKLYKERDIVIPHSVLFGMPGTGKTTLAKTIAYEAGVEFYETVSTNFSKVDDVVKFLLKMKRGDILFIDEIHGLKRELEEVMYSAMQDFYIVSSDGIQIDLPKFTVIGATTLPDEINKPLRDRFIYNFEVPLYSTEEIAMIVENQQKTPISYDDCLKIAKRSFGTPRVAINYYRNIELYAISLGDDYITKNHIEETFKQKKIDEFGLGSYHYAALTLLKCQESNAMGIQSLSSAIGISKKLFETYVQPGLFYYKLINISSKGRTLTEKGISFVEKGIML